MRSVSSLVALAGLALALSGCVSTQRIAARARLVDARIRISQGPTRVTVANPAVGVQVSVVSTARDTAFAVWVHNRSARPLTDLPISVGWRWPRGDTLYLNQPANLDYFDAHIAAVAAHATVVWVFTGGGPRPPRAVPFARVGVSPLPAAGSAALPRVTVTRLVAQGSSLALSLRNTSTIPQYDLQLDAVATGGRGVLAAGRAAVAHLGTHGTTTLHLNLLGTPGGAVHVSVLPTIFD